VSAEPPGFAARARPALARAAAELPLLVVAVVLLSTAAGALPPDPLISVGEVKLNAGRILILIGLVAVLAQAPARGPLLRTGLALPVALLLLVSLATTIEWETWARFRFLVEGVALLYLTFATLRARPDAREPLLAVAAIALAVAAVVGIGQAAQGDATGFYRVDCVPLTKLAGAAPPDSVTRAIGTFSNPNVLAGYLLLLAPLGALVAGAADLRLRLGAGLAVSAGYVAVVLTFSRAAVLVALVALAIGIAASGAARRRLVPLLGVAAALILALVFLAASCGSEATAGYGRGEEWRGTIEVIGDYPARGVGLGRLGAVLQARDERSTAAHAHNLFLTWWAEAGTGALLAWVAIFALLLWRTLRAAIRGSPGARAALVALVGFAGFSMLDHPANADRVAAAMWIVFGIAAAAAPVGESRVLAALRRRGRPEPAGAAE
jgi:putative inorganic carbon (HCO3(-)) transporter